MSIYSAPPVLSGVIFFELGVFGMVQIRGASNVALFVRLEATNEAYDVECNVHVLFANSF